MARSAVALILTTVTVGLLTAWLWAIVTPLPGYTVNADGGATTTEHGLAEFVVADVVFCAIGLPVGIGLGIVAWRGFGRRLGWPAVPIGAAAALVAAVLCWQVGPLIGPHDFATRLATATVGDTVPIDLRLRAVVSLAVWVLGACGAQLVATAVLHDPDDGYPVRLPWSVRDIQRDRWARSEPQVDDSDGGVHQQVVENGPGAVTDTINR